MTIKYPESIRLPVIVPKGAQLRPLPEAATAGVVEVSPFLLILGAALLLLIPERILPLRSGRPSGGGATPRPLGALSVYPKQSKRRRLYYMYYPSQRPAHPLTALTLSKAKAKKLIAQMREGKAEGRLFPVFAKTADDARKAIAAGQVKEYSPSMGLALSGDIMNCAVWQPVWDKRSGGEVWRCLVFGESCKGPECVRPGGRIKTCIDRKRVFSPHYGKKVDRCAKYVRSCTGKACLPETMPIPDKPILRHFDKKVRDVAEDMAEDANAAAAPWLTREILSRGGIKSYRKGVEKEEYKEIPVHLRNRRGLAPDEMAAEIGISSQELFDRIAKLYPKGRKKQKKKYSWEDFKERAGAIVEQVELGPEGFRGVGAFLPIPGVEEGPREQELFPGLKRELALEVEDVATSDDPLEICLQRRGWRIPRVNDLQRSIAEKAVPDMYTGKTGTLTSTEKDLQKTIDECLRPARGGP